MYRFDDPLQPHEVAVHLAQLDAQRPGLAQSIAEASARYGFGFTDSGPGQRIHPAAPGLRHSLLLVVRHEPFTTDAAEWALGMLDQHALVSVAFEYCDEQTMLSARDAIEMYKARSLDRINFLRPCEEPDGRWIVPDAKIIDNSICDSVRVKYRPRRRSRLRATLSAEQSDFFQAAAAAFRDYRLYHRSQSDGYFACRAPDGGFFITATKTYKGDLDLDRVVHVHDYCENTNVLSFSGGFLPSSDSVEAALLFNQRPDVTSVMHTHASDRFTRNPDFRDRILVGIEPYGEPELGRKLVAALDRVDDGFVIMEDHGEIFVSPDYGLSRTLREAVSDPVAHAMHAPAATA